jgi:hypothetical protein
MRPRVFFVEHGVESRLSLSVQLLLQADWGDSYQVRSARLIAEEMLL